MKKKILSALFCLISAASAIAVEPGYRGFVDLGYALSVSELQVTAGGKTYTSDISDRIMVSTTHGYQIAPYVFVGAGVGLTYWYDSDNKSVGVPIFADLRADILPESRFCPFVNAKIGYSVADIEGLYFNPTIGVRFALTEVCGLNIGVGYQVQKVKDIEGSCNAVTFKLGFDF